MSNLGVLIEKAFPDVINPNEAFFNSQVRASSRQKILYEKLLEQSPEFISNLFKNKESRDQLKGFLTNYNIWSILDRYNKEHAKKDSSVNMQRYETDEGALYQIQLSTGKTVNFTRNYALGSERILSADPIEMSGDEWNMFVDRGHGLYATSMVTRVIATLGKYIAEVEARYNFQPIKDKVTGKYYLSEMDEARFKEKDPNSYQKYLVIRDAQNRLRNEKVNGLTLYELERNVDPNHTQSQFDFKTGVQSILDGLRSVLRQQQLTKDTMSVSSDDIIAYAKEQVAGFKWPSDEHGRRFAITEGDQLLVKRDLRIKYDPSKEPSSAAGGTVYATTAGFGEEGAINYAHCTAILHALAREEREALMQKVRTIKPSEGLKLEATSQKDRARETESLRIALTALETVTEITEAKSAQFKRIFNELIAPYDTETGREICKEQFGCSVEEFKYRVLFHAGVLQPSVDVTFLVKQDEAEKLTKAISSITEEIKYKKREISLPNLESAREKLTDELSALQEKHKSYLALKEKLDGISAAVEKIRSARDNELGKIKKFLGVADNSLDRNADKKALVQNYVKKITEELLKKDSFSDRIKFLNHVMNLCRGDYCFEVLGCSKSEFHEEILRNAMSASRTDFLIQMKSYAKSQGTYGALVSEVESTKKSEKELHSDRIISRKADPLLEDKAKDIAESAATRSDPIKFILAQAKNRAPDQERRLTASALYRYALSCDESEFTKIKDIKKHLTPYYDVATLIEIRALLAKAAPLKNDFQAAYKAAYEKFLSEQLKKLGNKFSFLDAINAAQQLALEDNNVRKAKDALDDVMQKINPHRMEVDREEGDVFLRTGVLGFVYKALDPLFGVLEGMGLHDPVRGALALGVMGATMGFTLMAHGATVAAASTHNAFMHFMATKTAGIIPEIYKNMVVLNAKSSGFKTVAASMIEGVTVGKAFYLLTSAADIATTGHLTGFTGDVIKGVMNNPIETAVLISVMALMGHGVIMGLHEQADTGGGGWEIFAGLGEALKLTDVAFHIVKEIAMVAADGMNRSGELKNIEDTKALFAGMFAQSVFNQLDDKTKKEITGKQLFDAFSVALKDIDITNPIEMAKVTEQFLNQIPEGNTKNAIKAAIQFDQKKDVAVTPSYKGLYNLLTEEKIQDEKTIITPLKFLEEKYKKEAKAFSAGAIDDEIHRKNKQAHLAGFFIKDLLMEKSKNSTAWRDIFANEDLQNQVATLSGMPWEIFRDQAVPKFRTEAEKAMDVVKAFKPSKKATAEGAGRLALLGGRVVGNVVGTFYDAAGVVATTVAQGVTDAAHATLGTEKLGLIRGGSNGLQTAARHVGGFIATHTTYRADNVSKWRREFTGAELIGKAGTFLSNGLSEQKFYYDLRQMVGDNNKASGNFISTLSSIATKITDDKKSIGTSSEIITESQVLDFLKLMFKVEVKDLEEQLNKKGINNPKDRDSHMMASLQKLCRDEIMMCSKAEIAVLKNNVVLVQMLAGQKIDFNLIKNPVKENAKAIEKSVQSISDSIYTFATAVRNEGIGKNRIPDYRMSKKPVDIVFDAKASSKELTPGDKGIVDVLKEVRDAYHKNKSAFGLDSALIKRLSFALDTLPADISTYSPEKAALYMLSKMFPVEAGSINSALLGKDISLEDREAVMLKTLQGVFKAEIMAAGTLKKNFLGKMNYQSETAYNAFTDVFNQFANSDVKQLLTGFGGDFKTLKVKTKSSISSIFYQGEKKKDGNPDPEEAQQFTLR